MKAAQLVKYSTAVHIQACADDDRCPLALPTCTVQLYMYIGVALAWHPGSRMEDTMIVT